MQNLSKGPNDEMVGLDGPSIAGHARYRIRGYSTLQGNYREVIAKSGGTTICTPLVLVWREAF